jgi:uncharacterized protein
MGGRDGKSHRVKASRAGLREIRRVAAKIAELVSPRQIILFGSHARGQAGRDSDVDLLVVTEKPLGPDASLRIRRRIEYAFPLDLIVCDVRRLERRVQEGDYFLREAVEHGRVLYEEADL